MTQDTERIVLLLGATRDDVAVSKPAGRAAVVYRQKILETWDSTWRNLAEMVNDPKVAGVIVRLTRVGCVMMGSHSTRAVAARSQLLHAISSKPHIVLVSLNDVAPDSSRGPYQSSAVEDDDFTEEDYRRHREFRSRTSTYRHMPIDDQRLRRVMHEHDINLVFHRTTAELHIIASSFIEGIDSALLFRVYVPSGRLYAAEADKLVGLFRTWLNQTSRYEVRQDGYSTAAGQVFEFFGNPHLALEMKREFADFAQFLNRCIDDPQAAERGLLDHGVEASVVPTLVERYGKEARRLQLDMRHERERRILTLRHQLESELSTLGEEVGDSEGMGLLVGALVPPDPGFRSFMQPYSESTVASKVTINVSQQYVQAAQGAVIQNIQGSAHLGIEARELLDLVSRFGGPDGSVLESAVHELEDAEARPNARLSAKSRLKQFLFRIGGHVEGAALDVLQKYVEAKIGI